MRFAIQLNSIQVEGRDCVVLSGPGIDGHTEWTMSLAHPDYLPIRAEVKFVGDPAFETTWNYDFAGQADPLHSLKGWSTQGFGEDGKVAWRGESVVTHAEYDKTPLAFEYPIGTIIQKKEPLDRSIVTEAGTRPLSKFEIISGVKYAQLLQGQTYPLTSEDNRRYSLILLNVAFIGFIIAFVGYRYYKNKTSAIG